MKKKGKKNQIVITALAAVVAIAGYLTYAGTQFNVGDEMFDITETGIFTDTEDESLEAGVDTASAEDGTDTAAEAETVAQTEVPTEDMESETDSEETTDEETAETSEEQTGSAILAGTDNAVIDYASEVKLNREQVRSKNKETLLELINNANLTEEQRQAAVDAMVEMTDVAEREAATEMLLEAKGFQDVVVSITEDSCDVVVNLASVTDTQRAQLEDIVKRKAGVAAENIVITPLQSGS